MFYHLLWSLMALCRFFLAAGLGEEHPHIFPLSPLIERGSTLKIFCSLGKNLVTSKNASHIIWTLNDKMIPEENYVVINDSISGLILHNFIYGRAHVKCFVDSPFEKQQLGHSEVKTGLLPQAPGNVSCIFYLNKNNVTCSWNSGRETNIETTYTLIRRQPFSVQMTENCSDICHTNTTLCKLFKPSLMTSVFKYEIKSDFKTTQSVETDKIANITCVYSCLLNICRWTARNVVYSNTGYRIDMTNQNLQDGFLERLCSRNNGSHPLSCSDLSTEPFALCFWVVASNSLGEAMSEQCHSWEEIAQLDPPEISKIETNPGMKQTLMVTWKKPEITINKTIKCQARYRIAKLSDSGEAYMQVDTSTESFILSNLGDFAEYAVALRCILNRSRFWSDWSTEQKGTTEEQAPSREVDLWRIIESYQPTGHRTVHLLWKLFKEFPSSGMISGYKIKYFPQSKPSVEKTVEIHNESTTHSLSLTAEAYMISVIAQNAAGDSPEAVLRIPSVDEDSDDHKRIVSLNCSSLNEQMVVEWETDDLEVNRYVVEWYWELEKESYKRSWQYIDDTNWISQKGAFEPYKCYIISVYPLHKGEIKAATSIRTYFLEGAPSIGPVAEVENIDKNEATVKWKEVEKAKTNGVIIHYTIFYVPDGGKELGETVNASVLQYRLKSLQGNTKYTVHVMASTVAGGANGTRITISTSKLSVLDTVFINVVVGLFVLCLLTAGLLWVLKRRSVKRICWPEIPHPSLLECPDLPQTLLWKEPQSEGDIETIDLISVLEIDAPCEDSDEFMLAELENCVKQTKVATKDVAGRHDEILCSGQDTKAILPTTSHTGPNDKSEMLPALGSNPMIKEQLLQTLGESLSLWDCPFQNSGAKGDESEDVPEQTSLKETSELNPYLKNSTNTREFLVCENLPDRTRKETETQTGLLDLHFPNGSGLPYVTLDTFELTPKHS